MGHTSDPLIEPLFAMDQALFVISSCGNTLLAWVPIKVGAHSRAVSLISRFEVMLNLKRPFISSRETTKTTRLGLFWVT